MIPDDVKQVLEEILRLPLAELRQHHIDFLRARSSYLNPEQKKKYSSVLGEQAAQEEVTPPQLPQEPAGTQFEVPANDPGNTLPEKQDAQQTDNVTPAQPGTSGEGNAEQVNDEGSEDTEETADTEESGEEETEVGSEEAETNEENPYGASDADPDAQQ